MTKDRKQALLQLLKEAPDKSEFFYPRRTEDDWEKKIF